MVTLDQINSYLARRYPAFGKILRGEPTSTAELTEFRLQLARDRREDLERDRRMYHRPGLEDIQRIARLHPEATAVKWSTMGCTHDADMDNLEWLLDGTPIGHDTPLRTAPPTCVECSCMLLAMDYFSPAFNVAVRAKNFDLADALIESMRSDKDNSDYRLLKAEVAGRRAAHQRGERFLRKKHMAPSSSA